MRTCGGCEGKGAHIAWCPAVVGPLAAHWGRLSRQADGLADQIGSNDPGSANMCYQVAARLRAMANERAEQFDGVNRDGSQR